MIRRQKISTANIQLVWLILGLNKLLFAFVLKKKQKKTLFQHRKKKYVIKYYLLLLLQTRGYVGHRSSLYKWGSIHLEVMRLLEKESLQIAKSEKLV